jgi:hypothetical protein
MNPLNANVCPPHVTAQCVTDDGRTYESRQPIFGFKDKSKRATEYDQWLYKVKPSEWRLGHVSATATFARALSNALTSRFVGNRPLSEQLNSTGVRLERDGSATISVDVAAVRLDAFALSRRHLESVWDKEILAAAKAAKEMNRSKQREQSTKIVLPPLPPLPPVKKIRAK